MVKSAKKMDYVQGLKKGQAGMSWERSNDSNEER